MRALDTNVLVRFLVNDDEAQGRVVRKLFDAAEASGERLWVTRVVLLELLWVLRAIYGFDRRECLEALELLTQLPVLELEDHDGVLDLVRLGRSSRADLPDLLIGLAGRSAGAGTTLTFEKGLASTGLFRRLQVPPG